MSVRLIFLISIILSIFLPITVFADGNNITVVTYNTWGLPSPILMKPGRFKKIVSSIDQFNADVIGFQETFTKFANVLNKLKNYPYTAYGSPKIKKKKSLHSGLLTVSKYPILDSDYIVYSKCTGTDCLAAKGVLWTKISFPGVGEVNVFNTHTNAGGSEKVRYTQLSEALHFIEQKRGDRPTIFIGDFNFQPGTNGYNQIHYNGNFEDSLDLFLDKYPQFSQDPDYIYSYNLWNKLFRRRLDYVWLQNGNSKVIDVDNYQVIFNGKNGQRLSDHLGLKVNLTIH